jgi:hypothetical protein
MAAGERLTNNLRVLAKRSRLGYVRGMSTRISALAAAGFATLLLAAAGTAHAQGFGGGVGPGGAGGGSHGLGAPGGGKEAKPKTAPPDALPGAAVDKDRIIPSDHGVSDLPPTEALFDAVNRGDIADARDAISRGAEINGRNVLGLTPLDLSVDLGRNDITFLLLSLRDLDGPTRPKVAPAASKQAKPAKPASDRTLTARASAPAAPPAPRTATLFAGNGGAPVPNAGFLGFDAVQR